jgi:hypothetical protein
MAAKATSPMTCAGPTAQPILQPIIRWLELDDLPVVVPDGGWSLLLDL